MKRKPNIFVLDPISASEDSSFKHEDCLKLVCLSDTHGKHWDISVPHGDVLIHSGDFTNTGTLAEVEDFDAWLGTLPHKHKVVVPGNHDSVMDFEAREFILRKEAENFNNEELKRWETLEENTILLKNADVLVNKSIKIEGVKIFGTPHTIFNGKILRTFFRKYAYAFGCVNEDSFGRKMKGASKYCDVFISHSPPLGISDTNNGSHRNRGSLAILHTVFKVNPALHIFGHVHLQGGQVNKLKDCPENRMLVSSNGWSGWWWTKLKMKTTFVNAASLQVLGLDDHSNSCLPELLREPVVVFLHKETKKVFL